MDRARKERLDRLASFAIVVGALAVLVVLLAWGATPR